MGKKIISIVGLKKKKKKKEENKPDDQGLAEYCSRPVNLGKAEKSISQFNTASNVMYNISDSKILNITTTKNKQTWNLLGNVLDIAPPYNGRSEYKSVLIFIFFSKTKRQRQRQRQRQRNLKNSETNENNHRNRIKLSNRRIEPVMKKRSEMKERETEGCR